MERNAAALGAWGAPAATTFAYPYGDVSLAAKMALGGRYDILRALHHGLIEAGTDLNQAPAVGIEGPDGEAIARGWIDRAVARRAWLILYTHDVVERPSPFGCTPGRRFSRSRRARGGWRAERFAVGQGQPDREGHEDHPAQVVIADRHALGQGDHGVDDQERQRDERAPGREHGHDRAAQRR